MSLRPTLDTLAAEALRVRAAGREPLVILDLDGTLYDCRLRTLRILLELAHLRAQERPELVAAVRRLASSDVRYRVRDTLAAVGITDPATVDEAETFWGPRFFSGEYVLADLPTPGAVAFVQGLHAAGATPCYVTGRDAPNLLVGTVRALQRDGFPVGTLGTRLALKEDPRADDVAFKSQVVERLGALGEVIAAFDNEPGLCNRFRAAFPAATVVHLATAYSHDAPALAGGIPAIPDFRPLLPEELTSAR
jgi:hypothetical protein